MKDIDFDELDRAVSSLLGKPGEAASAPASSSAPVPTPAANREEPKPVVTQQPTMQNSTATAVSQKSTPQANRQAVTARPPSSDDATSRPNVVRRPSESSSSVTQRSMPYRQPAPTAPVQAPKRDAETRFPISPLPSQELNTKRSQPAPSVQKPAVASAPTKQFVSPAVGQQNSAKPKVGQNRFMDMMRPPATKQAPSFAKPKPTQPQAATSRPQPNSSNSSSDTISRPTMTPPKAPELSQSNTSATVPPAIRRTGGVMGAPSMPSRVSHAGKNVVAPKAPKPSSFVDSLIPKMGQKNSPARQDADQPLLAAPDAPKRVEQGERGTEELLTARAGRPAKEQQRRIAEEIPSPFLTDAKVEKRPLGGSVPSGASHSDVSTVKQTLDAEATRLDQQAEVRSFYDDQIAEEAPRAQSSPSYASVVPQEFNKDIVNIEESDPEASGEKRPDTPPAFPPEKKMTKPVATATQGSQAAQTAAMSIPQQYRAKVNTPDKTPRSIFDTEEYHKPLPAAAPKKKKSHPIVWILLIILLLAVGAGIGIAAYFLVG